MEKRTLIKTCKNGTKIFKVAHKCEKCGGTGKIPFYFFYANGVCFDCDGSGVVYYKEYEHTPEYLEKQRIKLEKKAQKEAEERAKREAELKAEEERRKAREAEIEAKYKGHYFGEIGQKIEIEVTFVKAISFETQFGYMTLYRFDTDDGAHLVWKSSADLGSNEWLVFDGDRITIKATIKEHKEYNGQEQTVLTRVKVVKSPHEYATYPRTNGELFDYDLIVFPNGEKRDRLGVRYDDERKEFFIYTDEYDDDGKRIKIYSNTIEISKTKLF